MLAERQNWYPDFTFVSLTNTRVKFALDFKTTYRDGRFPGHVNGFTLGSHGTYFRNRTSRKNIQFPYGEYAGHFCLGAIYSRVAGAANSDIVRVRELGGSQPNDGATAVDSLRSIASVIEDFQFFVHEKWRIASDRRGSGNTANIGSVTYIDDLLRGNGVFARLGEDWFDEYWMNYDAATVKRGGETVKLRRLEDFIAFKGGDARLIVPVRTKRKTDPGPK